jgi:hypothetical protein
VAASTKIILAQFRSNNVKQYYSVTIKIYDTNAYSLTIKNGFHLPSSPKTFPWIFLPLKPCLLFLLHAESLDLLTIPGHQNTIKQAHKYHHCLHLTFHCF